MNKLILIDGSSLLNIFFWGNMPREYYSAKSDADKEKALEKLLKTSNGDYTSGVYPMTKSILDIIYKQKPTHLAVAWDITRDTFRKKLYNDYKAHRDETLPQLKSQFALMQEVLDAMNIRQFKDMDYEADDLIGTLAKKFQEEIPTYIMTKDQDALQLVNNFTRLWLRTDSAKAKYEEHGLNPKELAVPDGYFEFTPYYIEYYYGLTPDQIIDYKALMGDTSDNIPGVKGVGEKTAIPLLQEYKNIETLYSVIEHIDEKDKEAVKAFYKPLGISKSPLSYLTKVGQAGEITGKDAAFLSKTLATIVTDVPGLANVSLQDLSLELNIPGMVNIFKLLEFKSLLSDREPS